MVVSMDFCAERNRPDVGRPAWGVTGWSPEFSLTFSCLTKDRPCVGFLLGGSWWTAGTSLSVVSGAVSSLFCPPPSKPPCQVGRGDGIV